MIAGQRSCATVHGHPGSIEHNDHYQAFGSVITAGQSVAADNTDQDQVCSDADLGFCPPRSLRVTSFYALGGVSR